MEPAEPLPVKLTLDNEDILLIHHSMYTPSDYNFSVLRNPTQNFMYRGILWLTDKNLVYKGFPVKKVGANQVSEKVFKPFCEVDTSQPFEKRIVISKIIEVFIGHDNTFNSRYQRYPKLRITYKDNGEESTTYFYLIRENLIDDELYIQKRCSEWQSKIKELLDKIGGVQPTTPTVPIASTIGAAATPPTATRGALVIPPAPTPPRIGTDVLLEKAEKEIGTRRFGKVTVKPLDEREKPKFAPVATPIPSETEEEEPAFTRLLDAIVPVSDDEFSAATADTSIAKCPHCGWILGYSTSKCPRCRKII